MSEANEVLLGTFRLSHELLTLPADMVVVEWDADATEVAHVTQGDDVLEVVKRMLRDG